MSYDVYIGDSHFNYTFNGSQLWYQHINGGLPALDGLKGSEAAEKIGDAFTALRETYVRMWKPNEVGAASFRAQYDAPNGWGSTVGILIFMGEIMTACIRNPNETLRVER